MKLTRLFLRNFRNYPEVDIPFEGNTHVIVGPNASGKTNILEAIFFLATTRSHRTHRNQELIRWGEEGFFIKARVKRKGRTHTLELLYGEDGRRGLRIDGVRKHSLADLRRHFSAVFFSPEDLELVKGSPSVRRRFLNDELSHVNDNYEHVLGEYRQALEHRNRLLKGAAGSKPSSELLSVWDDQLLEYGVQVMVRRVLALRKLEKLLRVQHNHLVSSDEELLLEYKCSVLRAESAVSLYALNSEELRAKLMKEFAAQLEGKRELALKRGYTLSGPHRDDLLLRLNGVNARSYASQGQQRTLVLALKLASVAWKEEHLGEKPVLLLDDVLSELDPTRRNRLLEHAADGTQTFITSTDLSPVQEELAADPAIYTVSPGTVELVEGEGSS